ncbi:uncharacterized protein B0H64DRAFT_375012 [Chaetomium fimeti]|uniref:Gal80p-like C-terminal domain-containing protein n=1 Tax=Chaetomium fimeti TaxID=1854472 RepID=A0AAE0LQK3_9PEZI|nr:hypothetical protein B0H64DRAFT_375012 [Chaetomium fimeti]
MPESVIHQGRWAPPVLKIKELLQSGVVGTLLSSEFQVYGGSKDREILPVGLKYFAELAVGGNPITIGLGHVIDFIQSARPDMRIRDPERNDQIVETIQFEVPDLVSLHGS